MKFTATRTFALSPTKTVRRGETFDASEKLGAHYVKLGMASAPGEGARPSKPSRSGGRKSSSRSPRAKAPAAPTSPPPAGGQPS